MSSSSTTLRRQIAGIDVTEFADRFGTPTFVYDADVIRQRVSDLRSFDVVRFAQKACSNLAIVDLVRRCGGMVDSVSAGEIRRALAAGFEARGAPPPIVYTADIFDREALDLVVKHNIHVNVGSPDMIDQLGRLAPGRNVTIRVNPGFGHGHSRKTNTGGPQSKHGVWHEQLEDCLLRTQKYNLAVTGLHIHIGSGTDWEHLARVCGAMESAAEQVGRSLTSISAGGGLPIRYRESDEPIDLLRYYQLWDATRKRLEHSFGHPLTLEIEPGRYLTAESGYLIAEVRAIKSMGANLFYLLDAGFNCLPRPILYGAYHPMSLATRDGRTPSECEVIVGGPLCESGDIFTQEEGGLVCKRLLPLAQIGDLLIIECAGAYGAVMASNYNAQPFAAEVLVDGAKAHVIRKRQTFEDLIRGEIIPSRD